MLKKVPMENSRRAWWILCLFAFLLVVPPPFEAFAQKNKTVKGKVVDSTGEPIIGASIKEKSMGSNGTITDLDGNFTLKLKGSGKTLIISYIGMSTKEVDVTPGKIVEITLEDDKQAIDEVVVIGYGSKARKDLTGSVGSVSGARLARVPVASAAEALQGKIAGVQVTSVDGAPGAEINIRVRGGTSVTQSNDPLFIVDGFQVDNINDIPPTDIQSIDVLKDASLTAIYGAKGGNGVIIVTTKSAQEGKVSVNLNMYAQTRTLARKLDLMEPYDFIVYQYDRAVTSNSRIYKFRSNFGNPMDFDLYKQFDGNDWQDEILGGHPMSYMYNATIGGGNEKVKFNTSITHNDERGVLVGSGVRRTNVNIKLNAQITPKLKVLFNPRLTFRRDEGAGADNVGSGGIINVLRYRPTNGLREFAFWDPATVDPDEEKYFEYTNPKNDMKENFQLKHSYSYTNQLAVEWNPFEGFTFRSEAAHKISFSDQNRFWGYITSTGQENNNQPVAQITDSRNESYSWTNTISYGFSLKDVHNFSLLAGQEIQHSQSKSNLSSARYFPKDISARKALNNMNLGTAWKTESSISTPDRTASFFGQLNYNYDHRYLASLTFRADGSTKFAPGNQWGYFPAFSAAWVISEEDFMKDIEWISYLKLRAAIGMAGNNRIDNDMWRYQFQINSTGGPGFGEANINGEQYYVNAGGSTFPNADIKWETTITRNLAIDLNMFDSRLRITPEIYWNTTRDLLYESYIPITSGYTTQMQNIGQVTNKGFELTIDADIIQTKDFSLSANFVFGANKTRIDKLNNTDDVLWATSSRWKSSDNDYCLKVGDQLGLIYGYVYDGIYGFDEFEMNTSYGWDPKEGTVNCDALFGTAPGRPKFKNMVDGVRGEDDVNRVDENDRVVIGNTNPDFTGGFGLNGVWKDFDFSCNFNYMYGFDVNNATRYDLSSSKNNDNNYFNVLSEFKDCWRYASATGDRMNDNRNYVNEYQEVNANKTLFNPVDITKNVTHSLFIEDGSFLRLQDVTVGYTLPQKLMREWGVERLRVYFSGYNLWLWTSYSGYDPEVDVQSGLTPGVDYNRYPRSRNYLLGFNVTF